MLRLVCKRGGGLFMSIFFLTHGPRAVTYGGGGGGGALTLFWYYFRRLLYVVPRSRHGQIQKCFERSNFLRQ